jgi:hypothetical protein
MMAFIKTISVREADDELRAIYGMIRSDTVGSPLSRSSGPPGTS